MHLLKSNWGRLLPSTSTICIAPTGQSLSQTLQADPIIDFTSKARAGQLSPNTITLQEEISYLGWPRKFSESFGLTNGYFVVDGLLKMCWNVSFSIVDIAFMRPIFSYTTIGITQVTIATVSMREISAPGKSIFQFKFRT